MSTASLVAETRDLSGDDAWELLRRTGRGKLLKDAFLRMRVADGFSHARSLAFMFSLVAVQGVIALEGLAGSVGKGGVGTVIAATVRRAVPGPAGQVLTTAIAQAHTSAATHHYGALVIGALGAFSTATTALGQLERGLNRAYGVEQDRPSLRKYGLAALLTLTAGTLTIVAFACLAFGREVFGSGPHGAMSTTWSILRWPLGLGLIATAVTVLFRWCPRRRQPRLSWLAFGSGLAVALWALVTVGLGLFYRSSSTFGQTYGPLASVVALLVWCLLTAIALIFGASVAAQLEAVRAGAAAPQDAEKVTESEPHPDDPSRRRPVALTGETTAINR